ncbi:hypothetical protein DYU05_09425 [Mucilaginibacter terrenus]|uniref:DUF5672 domain-containing protein n=1 Tax=Mucilaginibacter terrenus TaxID=2482727 RepID=A0A3E2NXP8_9SPHI|nr:DUF5672 family protein [Mucilaginibacter terrenus]RFZ85795.1 hypothetical protein DYU05_09425 [Mucilaginibacter terrenus]
MLKEKQMCVVIPVHNPVPTENEIISLLACKAHLNDYDCYLLYPEGMNISKYIVLHPGLQLMLVNKDWLSSIEKYNKMKVSTAFYQLFSSYSYMLTYELDAYIFSNDVEKYNAFKYDYIGAPFFEGYWKAQPGAKFIKGCNSGFSVRNISACINALKYISETYKPHWLLYKTFLMPSSRIKKMLNGLTRERYDVFVTGKFAFNFANFHLNEDLIWSEIVPQIVPQFRVAESLAALAFSFEYNLEDSLKLNGGKLPLGCHAWAKNIDFWGKYIPASQQVGQGGQR